MNDHKQPERQNKVYSFGVKSKVLALIVNHPFLTAWVIILVYLLTFFVFSNSAKEMKLNAVKVFPIVFIGTALIVRLFCHRFCYRVEVDKDRNKIRFFLVFNQGAVEAPMNAVELRINGYLICTYGGKKFIISQEHINPILELFPKDSKVKFSGILHRVWKARFEKRQRLRKGECL